MQFNISSLLHLWIPEELNFKDIKQFFFSFLSVEILQISVRRCVSVFVEGKLIEKQESRLIDKLCYI